MKNKLMVLIAIFVVVSFTYYLYCTALVFKREEIETKRIKSPDGKVEVVLVESDTGATSSYILDIYIVATGKKIAKKDKPIFSAFSIKGDKIYWQKDRFLCIEYETAKISYFSNYEYPLNDGSNYLVEIKLIPMKDSAL
ncbi:MAG: hypothetical protein KAS96_02035 [Planctomycetes bacterium]|nr:hypothetical protein [Planctomycetota bacterium]